VQVNKSNSNKTTPSRTVVEIVRYFSLIISKIFWRIEYKNLENIPVDLTGGLIVTPNHQSYFDPFWVCIPIKKEMRFMAWDEAFQWFFIGRMLRLVGAFPISLKRGGTIKALKDAVSFLKEGKTLVIFPEGEREFADGNLLPFKTGAVRLAIETDVPILPVTVRGGNRIWSRDHKFPRIGKVEIIFHPTFDIKKIKDSKSLQQINETLKEIIASEL
jgi:1-acyl-sn-glycerol-3-phosphate acyltransferase